MELVGYLHITAADAFRHPIYKYVNNREIIYYIDYGGKSILLSLPDKYKKDDLSIVLSHNRTTYENEKHNYGTIFERICCSSDCHECGLR